MKKHNILDAYTFKGFLPSRCEHRKTTDGKGRIIPLNRRQKKTPVQYAAISRRPFMTVLSNRQETSPVEISKSICNLNGVAYRVRNVATQGKKP